LEFILFLLRRFSQVVFLFGNSFVFLFWKIKAKICYILPRDSEVGDMQYRTIHMRYVFTVEGSSWSWSYGSWIYNYPCNQWLSLLTLWVWITLRRDITLCDKVCQWPATGRLFSKHHYPPHPPYLQYEYNCLWRLIKTKVFNIVHRTSFRNNLDQVHL
jgi:hypothetical protein